MKDESPYFLFLFVFLFLFLVGCRKWIDGMGVGGRTIMGVKQKTWQSKPGTRI